MQTNQQFDLAFNLLQNTGTNLFLTGKAGTGKTTFLKRLKEVSPKRMIVVAPTGVAAINAGARNFSPTEVVTSFCFPSISTFSLDIDSITG